MNQTTNFRQFFQTMTNVSKKAAVAMALLLTLGVSSGFAAAKPADAVNGEISASFKKNFQHAVIMETEVKAAFTKLTFSMNGSVMFAFYSNSGELLAVTRNITSTQLPMNLLLSLKSDYSGYWITDLFELNNDEQSSYYVSLESADVKVTLRSNGDSWEVYTTMKK